MRSQKGQSTLEYAIIIAVVVGGLMVMQHYVKRGYSGKLRSAADEMGEQFDPNTRTGTETVTRTTAVTQNLAAGATTQTQNQQQSRTVSDTQGSWDSSKDAYGQ